LIVCHLVLNIFVENTGTKHAARSTRTMITPEDVVAILRIELEDIKPLIWRRVAVPSAIILKGLHNVIQAVMGWRDCHLWEFEAKGQKYSRLIPNDLDWNDRITNAANTKLSSVLAGAVTDIKYVYDMGDYWEHRVIVEKNMPAELGVVYPKFLGGERRCPPEDCGGVPGYHEFLGKLTSKQAKKRKAALDWYGGPYNPDDIDEEKIVAALKRFGSNPN